MRTMHECDAVELVVPPSDAQTRVLVLLSKIRTARATIGIDAPPTTRIEPTPITKRQEATARPD